MHRKKERKRRAKRQQEHYTTREKKEGIIMSSGAPPERVRLQSVPESVYLILQTNAKNYVGQHLGWPDRKSHVRGVFYQRETAYQAAVEMILPKGTANKTFLDPDREPVDPEPDHENKIKIVGDFDQELLDEIARSLIHFGAEGETYGEKVMYLLQNNAGKCKFYAWDPSNNSLKIDGDDANIFEVVEESIDDSDRFTL